MAIVWHESLSIGDDPIDHEHKQLIAIIDDIFSAMKEFDKGKAKTLFSNLHLCTIVNSNNEEKFMNSNKYPAIDEHHNEHENLKRQLKDHQDKLFDEGILDAGSVFTFIKDWLVTHLLSSDMKIKDFIIKSHGMV